MIKPDDVELQILRRGHGWSSARLWINEQEHLFTLTHIFDDPLAAIARAATNLSPKTDEVSFDWQDEPGVFRWTFERIEKQGPLYRVTIATYPDGLNVAAGEFEEMTFTTDYLFWKSLVLGELLKAEMLLRRSPYRDTRAPEDFPWREFRELQAQVEKGDVK